MTIFFWLLTALGLVAIFIGAVVLILWGAWELLERIGGEKWRK